MTLDRQIDAAVRELDLRRRCYPTWIAKGTMSESKAKYQIEAMEAILQTLRWVSTYQRGAARVPRPEGTL